MYITDLDPTKPTLVDPVAEGAEEIRAIKEALIKTFPYANTPLYVSNQAITDSLSNSLPSADVQPPTPVPWMEIERKIDDLLQRIEALEAK